MAFGDVNLAEQAIRGNHNPGAGGWPTIRYFNTATGLEGKPYTQKTSDSMCDELGKNEYMQAYIEEAGGVLLCEDLDCLCGQKEGGCTKNEHDYYDKFRHEKAEVIASRLKLLSSSLLKAAKKDAWMSQRVSILKLITATSANAVESKEEL